jgi:hypothetical protein
METYPVRIYSNDHEAYARPIKDPSIARLPNGSYVMYATTADVSLSKYAVTRFRAAHPKGPWTEVGMVHIHDLDGPEVCAPAIQISDSPAGPLYTLYIQTACFSDGGIIAHATSTDGQHFYASPRPLLTAAHVPNPLHTLVGLYDVAVSDVVKHGEPYQCMTFSGYRFIGCGDIYMTMRPNNVTNASWSEPKLILAQEQVPFHNLPGAKNFEWGLEGAKIMQLDDDVFLLFGVCFLDKAVKERGTRQRVFTAAARTPDGPFLPMDMPFPPVRYPHGEGENGHPDVIDLGNGHLAVLYQERAGDADHYPWHLRYAELDKGCLLRAASCKIDGHARRPPSKTEAHCLQVTETEFEEMVPTRKCA